MSREKLTRTSCDRCKNVIGEAPLEQPSRTNDSEGSTGPLLYVERNGTAILRFEDLDQKCKDRVDHLLKQLTLEKGDEKSDGNGAQDDKGSGSADTA